MIPQEKFPLSQNKMRNQQYYSFLNRKKKTVKDLVNLGSRLMRRAGLHPHFFGDNSLWENARYLAYYTLQLSQTDQSYLNLHLSEEDIRSVFALFERRIVERIPVEYITNEANYLGISFYVNEHVLVPRSLMSTRFQDFLSAISWSNKRVLDLCTGSGCIGISLALLHPDIQVDLADISAQALQVAAANIKRYALENRVRCIQGNLFENIRDQYDLIITNPPYVSTAEYRRGPWEFKNEPRLALESGEEGLDIIHQILREVSKHLTPQGKLIAEVGFPAAKRLQWRYPRLPFKWYTYRKPSGKTPFLAMDCIFECQAKDLPPAFYRKAGWIRRFWEWVS